MNNCENNRPCPCTFDCPNHGKCCACVANHRDHNEGVPGCFFSKEAEGKQAPADILGQIKYFYFIDRYCLQWEVEQGHSDMD